jgi:hypothetical protein
VSFEPDCAVQRFGDRSSATRHCNQLLSHSVLKPLRAVVSGVVQSFQWSHLNRIPDLLSLDNRCLRPAPP